MNQARRAEAAGTGGGAPPDARRGDRPRPDETARIRRAWARVASVLPIARFLEVCRRELGADDVRLELGSNEAIKEAVAGGLGIGVVSRHALQGSRDVRELAVEDFPIVSRWHVVHPRAKQLSPIATAFRAHLLGHGAPG